LGRIPDISITVSCYNEWGEGDHEEYAEDPPSSDSTTCRSSGNAPCADVYARCPCLLAMVPMCDIPDDTNAGAAAVAVVGGKPARARASLLRACFQAEVGVTYSVVEAEVAWHAGPTTGIQSSAPE
jgi:hypothetical protein